MKFRELGIHTLRQAPNHARSAGEAWLMRAAYLTPDGAWTPLGERARERLLRLWANQAPQAFFSALALPVFSDSQGRFFTPYPAAKEEALRCPRCGYFALRQQARVGRQPMNEPPLPLERVYTPNCNTIEALAAFLQIPTARTAKALMFTRVADSEFIFVVLRGDTTLNLARLREAVGEVRPATAEEIRAAGAVPGYASPIGLRRGVVLVDEWIPLSPNLVAGANEEGYHLRNVNYGRDYTADGVLDLALAGAGDLCPHGDAPLEALTVLTLSEGESLEAANVLRALAEAHHDEHGLRLPPSAAPFAVYLLHLPGKELDTLQAALALAEKLHQAGLDVLLDDRDERAGVKFNDADLLGFPWRVTIGERALREGAVDLKARAGGEPFRLPLEEVPAFLLRAISNERPV